MKFGRSLSRNQVPEWSSYYLNYKALKKLIKELTAKRITEPGEEGDSSEINEISSSSESSLSEISEEILARKYQR